MRPNGREDRRLSDARRGRRSLGIGRVFRTSRRDGPSAPGTALGGRLRFLGSARYRAREFGITSRASGCAGTGTSRMHGRLACRAFSDAWYRTRRHIDGRATHRHLSDAPTAPGPRDLGRADSDVAQLRHARDRPALPGSAPPGRASVIRSREIGHRGGCSITPIQMSWRTAPWSRRWTCSSSGDEPYAGFVHWV